MPLTESYTAASVEEPLVETDGRRVAAAVGGALAGPGRAGRGRRHGRARPALDVRRAGRRGRAAGAGAGQPLRAGRADLRLGAEHARMGDPGVRRRPRRPDAGHRQSRLPAARAEVRAGAVALGRAVHRAATIAARRWPRSPPRWPPSCRRCARWSTSPIADQLFAIGPARRGLPRRAARRCGADPVHLRHHRLSQGRAAAPPRPDQQRPPDLRPRRGAASGETVLNFMPMFHTSGCACMTLGAVQLGCRTIIAALFDPGAMLDIIESEKPRPPDGRADHAGRPAGGAGRATARAGLGADDRLGRGHGAARTGAAGARGVRLRLRDGLRPDRDLAGRHPDRSGRFAARISARRSGGRCRRPRFRSATRPRTRSSRSARSARSARAATA